MEQKKINLKKIMEYNKFKKEDIIKICNINEEEFEEWMKGNEPALTVLIKLYSAIEKTKQRKRKKSIFNKTNIGILVKCDKRKIPERIEYYKENEIKNNECPKCEFPLQEDKQNIADFYGYDKTKVKKIQYCDSCKKAIIIYKKEGEDENVNETA